VAWFFKTKQNKKDYIGLLNTMLNLIDMVRLFTYLMKVSPNCQQVIANKIERSPGALEGSVHKECIVAMGLLL